MRSLDQAAKNINPGKAIILHRMGLSTRGTLVNDPSANDSFPIHPTGPDGLLFEGPAYHYTFVAPLPVALKGEGIPCSVILKRVQMPPEDERRQRAVEEVHLATRLCHPGIRNRTIR
jgi:hypothetical protein